MQTAFVVGPVTARFAYGALAPTILANLSRRYEHEAGIQVKHWAMWIFPKGTAVPVPTQIDATSMPVVRVCRLLEQTLQEIAQVEMRAFTEADKFNISTVIEQLKELHSLSVA
ncbi:hypothetical protein [Pseudomonas sp. MWU12-2323]|uniref:hypothetical protein n=1 Tax=Pseudomonas sp. MWU12-2323 TaxID=2651296 RepID=UPI00128BB2CD|nr:hypothetical protein [Pseudomonas sp. MWU12-2323]MPQ69388.1 hypothetical protein [Pseudomonas sp. MWU12-2323]